MENTLTKIETISTTPTSLSILEAAVKVGITSENVAVVEKILEMRRQELRDEYKRDFAKDFFNLKKALAVTSIYADKVAKKTNGDLAYTYCSESEISEKLEPLLLANGFTMLFSQRNEEGRTVAVVKLLHQAGHEETQEYSVRVGATNAMKDASAADSGSTTTAWRHLMIKLFGLKSRIRAEDDVRNEGDPNERVTSAQAEELEHRAKMSNSKIDTFLKLAGSAKFSEIPARNFDMLSRLLAEKERGK